MAVTVDEIYGVSNRWHTWNYVSVKKTRVMFKCKACKKVWAREYRKCHEICSPEGYDQLLRSENGKDVNLNDDCVCPECMSTRVTHDRVVGQQTSKPCDARCTGAKGNKCECACGGKHHGEDHLM